MGQIKKSKKGKAKKSSEKVLENATPVPTGKTAKVRYFGACTTSTEVIVLLEWGDEANGFEIVHAINVYAEAHIDRDFMGDGTKHFRISSINERTKDSEAIYWFDYLEKP